MTTKHTPGPWKKLDMSRVHGPKSQLVAIVYPCTKTGFETEESEANARLIAAAPETAAERDRLREENAVLLEALKECTSPIAGYAIKDEAQALEVLSDFLDHIRKVDAIARAAIAKAEGRS